MRLHLIDFHREVRRRHLITQDLFQAARAARALEEEPVLRVGIQRTEERHALNMVPMKVRNKDVSRKRLFPKFTLQLLAQNAESCAAIEDVDAVAETHLDAGGVASIAHVLGLWGGRGTANAPELDPHRLPGRTKALSPGLILGILRRWAAPVNCRAGSQPTISRSFRGKYESTPGRGPHATEIRIPAATPLLRVPYNEPRDNAGVWRVSS